LPWAGHSHCQGYNARWEAGSRVPGQIHGAVRSQSVSAQPQAWPSLLEGGQLTLSPRKLASAQSCTKAGTVCLQFCKPRTHSLSISPLPPQVFMALHQLPESQISSGLHWASSELSGHCDIVGTGWALICTLYLVVSGLPRRPSAFPQPFLS
jgi:hypothetical protein